MEKIYINTALFVEHKFMLKLHSVKSAIINLLGVIEIKANKPIRNELIPALLHL